MSKGCAFMMPFSSKEFLLPEGNNFPAEHEIYLSVSSG
jgi:hypothetical protein